MKIRIGHGLDIHQLIPGRPLTLGGVNIKSKLGILGHSDGDVVIHALVDAILGSLALGDIGTYFPSQDKQWKDIESKKFLYPILELVKKHNYSICNIDINIILESPKLNHDIPKIKSNLSKLLGMKNNNISVKAKTADKIGPIGLSKAIASTATVLIINHES